MQYGLAFAPLVPAPVLWIALGAIVVIAAILAFVHTRGAAIRVAALALILLALANPSFTREDREPLSSVAATPCDLSGSIKSLLSSGSAAISSPTFLMICFTFFRSVS